MIEEGLATLVIFLIHKQRKVEKVAGWRCYGFCNLRSRVLSSVSSRNSRFPEKNNAWTQVTDFANIKDRRLTLLLQMILFILNYNANNKAILLDKNVSWIIVKYEYNFEKFGIAIPTILLSNTSAWLPACLSLSIWLPFPERYGCSHLRSWYSVCFLIALWQVLTTCRYLYVLKGFTKGRHASDVPWQE